MTTWERRWPARVGVSVAVVGLVLIGLAQQFPNRGSIEDNLTQRSVQALEAAGIGGSKVSFSGRDGSVRVAEKAEVARAREIVAALDGVRVVDVYAAEAPPAKSLPAVNVQVDGGKITVSGRVSGPDARAKLLAALGNEAVDKLTVDGSVSDAGIDALPTIVKALGATAKGVTVELLDGQVTLTGSVEAVAAKDAAGAAAGQAVGSGKVSNRLEVAPPPEKVQQDLVNLPPITFEDDSATLTAQGQAAVAKAAELLRANPLVKVRIEGHTDGNGSADTNMVLSQARAKSVLDALVAQGIAADRLSSVGFGETQHKVPDDSPANRAINRRVEFVVLR